MHLARDEDRNRILNACVSELGAQGSESAGGRAAGGLVAAVQVDRGVAERAELERRLGHANDRYLRLYTNPPDGPGRRIRTRARPAAPGTICGDCALESRTTSCLAPAHLSQARGRSRSSSRSSLPFSRRPVNDTVPPRPQPVSAFDVISR